MSSQVGNVVHIELGFRRERLCEVAADVTHASGLAGRDAAFEGGIPRKVYGPNQRGPTVILKRGRPMA